MSIIGNGENTPSIGCRQFNTTAEFDIAGALLKKKVGRLSALRLSPTKWEKRPPRTTKTLREEHIRSLLTESVETLE